MSETKLPEYLVSINSPVTSHVPGTLWRDSNPLRMDDNQTGIEDHQPVTGW